jgi:hypothetical protein
MYLRMQGDSVTRTRHEADEELRWLGVVRHGKPVRHKCGHTTDHGGLSLDQCFECILKDRKARVG